MKIDPDIFKAYDIRGIYPNSLNEEIAYRIGKAYAKLLNDENPSRKLTIVVGSDMRISSPQLKTSIIKGLIDSGVNVVDVGLVTTPTFYFSVAYYGYDGGLQVSASHNPKEWNGLKMVRKRGVPISGDSGMYKIRDLVIKNHFTKKNRPGIITQKTNVVEELLEQEIKEWQIDLSEMKPLKVVVDTANAIGILDIEVMFKNLPVKLNKLNSKLDGTFPVHEPDPLKDENLEYVQKEVIKRQADIGISIDGDADRYFFVDNHGEVIRQEILRGIMAQLALKKYPKSKICYDIRPGKITLDLIKEAGGIPIVTKVGHSLIKEQMIKEEAVFAGESSGHYYYKFSFGSFDAPMVLTLEFLRFISEKNKPLSDIIKPYKKYFHSGEINSLIEDKEGKIKELSEKYADGNPNFLDGITIEYKDWWFNVRPSNTENKLRLNLEAKTKELMERKRDEVLKLIRT